MSRRRRGAPTIVSRVRVFWVLVLAGLAAAAAGGYALATAPWFRVGEVLVDLPPGTTVSEREVRAAAAVPEDANVWLLRTGAMRRRIEAIPEVDVARVARAQFPRPALTIRVTTRTPAACLRSGTRLATIDATSRVLRSGCSDIVLPRIDVPAASFRAPGATLTDGSVPALLADARVLTEAHLSVAALGRDRWGGLVATTTDHVRLDFGDDDGLAKKAGLVGPIRATLRERPLEAIDLRAPAAPVVRFRS